MYQLILVFHVLIAVSIIGLVLLQHGKGADIGAGFGSGASNTVFGSQGTGSFLFKLTGGLVMAFFITSVSLSSIVANQYKKATTQVIEQPIPNPTQNKIPIPEK
ncbi:MAG: preprotein translocase subunit SecG [Legionellales bacterium RIFCSPHIGHO2_12_FULL_35_11]|nr:MAG: preprotein translocase subunit SecG [Legionellales bacterium RIFCSPHIGHO2_12_FULL_35_11]